jgi:hypothetical protein
MGLQKHEAVIAIPRRDGKEAIEAFKQRMPEHYRRLLVGPVDVINGYTSFVLMPDGSKEDWGMSNEMDEIRAEFISLLESLSADWAHVVIHDEVRHEDDTEDDAPYIAASSAYVFGHRDARYEYIRADFIMIDPVSTPYSLLCKEKRRANDYANRSSRYRPPE